MSPPSRWSGLKYTVASNQLPVLPVSTLAVEWIEIISSNSSICRNRVSTLAVEWIEIVPATCLLHASGVSTLAVEWIEIPG